MRSILEFNSRFAVACLAVLSWIALREQVFGTPSGLSVLIEWLGLMVVAICLSAYARTGSRWLRVCASIAVSAFVIRSILERQTVPGYPAYWGGFGVSVLLAVVVVCGLLVMICSVVTVYQHPIFGVVRRMSKSVLAVLVWLGIGWILPTLIQPFDAWLNVGDSTEKFLDEIAGWVSGRIPGVGIGWHHNSLLGLPLGPMHFVSGFGVEKITMIVVFVNCLVLLVPVTVVKSYPY